MDRTTTFGMFTIAALTMGASAGVATSAQMSTGSNFQQLNLGDALVDVSTTSGNFASKTVGGYQMMGISGGHVGGEIDATESMRFDFDAPVRVTSLQLGALFIDGQHGDRVNERAFVTINEEQTFELALTGATSASWDGLGAVTNISQGLQGSGGVFSIDGTDIFGSVVSSLTLWAPQENASGSRGSDYGFVGLSTASIPAPGSVALLGLGGFLSSRRKRA